MCVLWSSYEGQGTTLGVSACLLPCLRQGPVVICSCTGQATWPTRLWGLVSVSPLTGGGNAAPVSVLEWRTLYSLSHLPSPVGFFGFLCCLFVFETGSLWDLGLNNEARLDGQQILGIHLSLPPERGTPGACHHASILRQ